MKRFRHLVRRDDGSISILVAVFSLGIILLLMVVWDAGSQVRTMQLADNIAAQAARTAGQSIDLAEAVAGGEKRVDPVRAQAAAQAYLAEAGVTGTVTFSPDLRQITVTTAVAYQPAMAGLPYRGPITITGRAVGQLVTG